MERITARVALRQVRPRELAGLRHTLQRLPTLRGQLAAAASDSALLREADAALEPPAALHDTLGALAAEPAVLLRGDGVIATGVDAELDELRDISNNCDAFLLDLEAREQVRTGIGNLRVQFNKVHGFYIEVTTSGLDRVPGDHQRRQTLKNAERFITPELKAFEDKTLSAQERSLAREKWLYEQMVKESAQYLGPLKALAQLDVLATLAERADTLQWTRPTFVNHPCIDIEADRHPVVQARLQKTRGAPFIVNHFRLDARTRMVVITGPDMGGKSTFMRQVVLTVLLASMVSSVPAQACRLGPIDGIYTRIGAADDLANAQSTFVVEMTEAAAILHRAGELSLVLMDEIGRGTSTFDGLALAGAIATHLHDRYRAFTLFATHYFEPKAFPLHHPQALNMHVGAVESGHDIVFLHELAAGPASRSHGVQVARLAGMPAPAERVPGSASSDGGVPITDRELAELRALAQTLAGMDPDALSPRQAWGLLAEMAERTRADDIGPAPAADH